MLPCAHPQANGKPKKPKQEPTERKNTSVYVTGLPLDATMEEVYDVFKKFGIIADSIDTGRPRVRLYADENGNFKGEALISKWCTRLVEIIAILIDCSLLQTRVCSHCHQHAGRDRYAHWHVRLYASPRGKHGLQEAEGDTYR